MPVEPVKIPQNVYVEDRIVGPLTLRQTLIMAVGGGFSYALWATLNKTYGGLGLPVTILAWVPCVIAVAFALIKINDLSLMRICVLLLEGMQKPKVRTYAPRRGITINIRTMNQTQDVKRAMQQKELAKTQETQEKIRALSSILDSDPTEGMEDTDEALSKNDPAPEQEPHPQAADGIDHLEKSVEPSGDERQKKYPVDPNKISADLGGNDTSDLSVFRDIFPDHPSHG